MSYTDAIQQAGGVPVIIPNDLTKEQLIELANCLDGFLFSGGVDVDPSNYGMQDDGTLGTVTKERDETELLLLEYLLNNTNKPILGICRGLQIINVAMGGTLIMDLETAGKNKHSLTNLKRTEFSHEIIIEKGTRLDNIMQGETRVNSFHHQAVDKLGKDLMISAYSTQDHVIEAFESTNNRFILCVQWHPEELIKNSSHKRLFEELVKQSQSN